ncbi:uncharacterized protein [Antennarius striatus]|uniref:uncharacterized protein n=1 Tax=Antennarius striatus TaxID=241820 RepID=UPI0035B3A925
MAVGLSACVVLLLSVCLHVKCADMPEGVFQVECRERYFLLTVDLSFVGEEPLLEAVDGTGVYPITERYAATCGYSVSILPLQGLMALRASYFSCHAHHRDDEFTFSFRLTATHQEEEVTFTLDRKCSAALPWSSREVTCEENYMEVSVATEVACPSGALMGDSNVLRLTPSSITSDWQVMFQKGEEQLSPMNLSDAQKGGYMFDLTDRRIVFRTPYGQPDSSSTEVNGVPVEVVHATLFSTQSWVVLMVDLVASCSKYVGSCDDTGSMVWETPDLLYPSVEIPQLSFGLNGELMGQSDVEERGYAVEKVNGQVRIRIPYDAEGRHRKSVVSGHLFEFYVYHLYVEQILVNQDQTETRVRFHNTLASPLLPYPVFTENRTVLQDGAFTVYLGGVPEDVALTAVRLNTQEYTVTFTDISSRNFTEVVHPNDTHGFTLELPFDDPVVLQQFSREDSTLQYMLDINYTLTVLPENEPFFHLVSIEALFTDVSPPAFSAECSESGISFKLDRRPVDSLWVITVGSDPLTEELAERHGYIMTNDSKTLLLHAPLFSHGYEYTNITLKGSLGTFEILVRDRETLEVQSSSVKTCPFTRTEFIRCSPDGWMTVVTDVSLGAPSGESVKVSLADERCGPKETAGTRVLFSFQVNSCGSTVKFGLGHVTYRNEILEHKLVNMNESVTERVGVQCTYQLAHLHRLFTRYRFEADSEGIGDIIHRTPRKPELSPTINPRAPPTTTALTQQPTRTPVPSESTVR